MDYSGSIKSFTVEEVEVIRVGSFISWEKRNTSIRDNNVLIRLLSFVINLNLNLQHKKLPCN